MTSAAPQEMRWGVLGMGMIASWFIGDLYLAAKEPRSVVHKFVAVASSSVEKAQKVIDEVAPGIKPVILTSYAELVKRDDLDCVYIASPHGVHAEHVKMCLEAGKNVLCEKPFTMNAKEAEALMAMAKEKNLFLMEAVWTRFFPITQEIQRLVFEEKIVGSPRRLFVDFALSMGLEKLPKTSRIVSPALGAGGLLDIGIYSLTWARLLLFQHPDNASEEPTVVSNCLRLESGIDEIMTSILTFEKLRAVAICSSSVMSISPKEFLRLEGSNGSVLVVDADAASHPVSFQVRDKAGNVVIEKKFAGVQGGRGFVWEADAVAGYLKAGKKESDDVIPLKETLTMMKLMDKIREQGGVKYPQDD